MMLPCKNMRHLNGKTCPLVIGAGGALVDAVSEVRNMLRVDHVPAGMASTTPLFRDPSSNEPLCTNHLRDMIRRMMGEAGEPDLTQFGTHSLRIGGATDWRDVFGADAERIVTQRGRWDSDIGQIYQRALAGAQLRGSTAVGDAEGADLETLCHGWCQPASFR